MILAEYALLAHALVVLAHLGAVPGSSWAAVASALLVESDALGRLFGAKIGLRAARRLSHRPAFLLASVLLVAVGWQWMGHALGVPSPPLATRLSVAALGVVAHGLVDVLGVRGIRWRRARIAARMMPDGDPVILVLLGSLLIVPRAYGVVAAAAVLGVATYLVALRAWFRRRAAALGPAGATLLPDPRGLGWFRAVGPSADSPGEWHLMTLDGARRRVLAEWFVPRLRADTPPKTPLKEAFLDAAVAPAVDPESESDSPRWIDAAIAPGSAGWPSALRPRAQKTQKTPKT